MSGISFNNTTCLTRGGHRRRYSDWFLLGCVVSSLILLTCSVSSADPDSKGCGERQHKCLCGIPKCISQELVKNGVQDCQDGSDEGQWDPSKCAIKNNTSEDIRFKRAALSELSRVTNLGATTTFFNGDRGRTRPVGLLTTTMGSFVTSGTTTEYITKVLATYIKGTYARILSTSSRIYHAVATDAFGNGENGDMMDMIKPTGFIASTVSNEINGYATTAHTTDIYRTYIDGTYAQVMSTYSNINYPPWYTDPIVATEIAPGHADSPGAIYATPVVEAEQKLESAYLFQDGHRPKTVIVPTKITSISSSTIIPVNFNGRFDAGGSKSSAVAEVGIIENENRLRALKPNKDSEVKVTGTHGKFIHTDTPSGDETTYNVFTGTYVQNSKTFLFFFGNTVIESSRAASATPASSMIQIENGTSNGANVVVDVSGDRFKVIVPSDHQRIEVAGSIDGESMPGVFVEIEGSEQGDITVDGARQHIDFRTPDDPALDRVVVTIGKSSMEAQLASMGTQFSVSSKINKEAENEIPVGRKVPDGRIQPTPVKSQSLPTYTVGTDDGRNEPPPSSERIVQERPELESAETVTTTTSSSSNNKKNAGPVFQRASPKPIRLPPPPPPVAAIAAKAQLPNALAYRSHRAFVDISDMENDLQSAASSGRATVTYVGFADFTTTVGNTVIVFMPRTKIIEDVAASKTASPTIEPTRYVTYTTTESTTSTTPEAETTSQNPTTTTTRKTSTTPKIRVVDPQQGFVTTQRSAKKNKDDKYFTTPKTQEDEEEATTELSPSETTVFVSGKQTVFLNQQEPLNTPRFNVPVYQRPVEATPQLPVSSPTVGPSQASRKTLFGQSSRSARPLPKVFQSRFATSASPVPESTPVPPSQSKFKTASTAVFQTDVANPTGIVKSIAGSVVNDKTTTLFTSLIIGTYIDGSYAQVIKSSTTVIPLAASKTINRFAASIRASKSAKIPTQAPTVYSHSYEVTTTSHSASDDEEGTTPNSFIEFDKFESSSYSTSSTSSTTESTSKKAEEEGDTTTTANVPEDEEEVFTTTVSTSTSTSTSTTPRSKDDDVEKENEVETGRKVQSRPQDQILVNVERPETIGNEELEPSSTSPTDEDAGEEDQQQTIYITRTLPTTLFRTYTYYTTYFIPEDEATITSVTSREVTSTSVGVVKKTFAKVLPSQSPFSPESVEEEELKPSNIVSSQEIVDGIRPSSVQIVYKTFFTTYTYLTTFFTGQTSSISSREEIISNIVTLTQGHSSSTSPAPSVPSSSAIEPTSSQALSSRGFRTKASLLKPSLSRSGKFSLIRRSKTASGSPVPSSSIVPVSSPVEEEASVEPTSAEVLSTSAFKTFFTTYTYFTTLFDGDDTSIKSRTEVVTNIVPTQVRATPIVSATAVPENKDEDDEYTEEDVVATPVAGKETTFYTTYTYLTTFFRDGSEILKSSLATYTKVVLGDQTLRSGIYDPNEKIEPTQISARSAAQATVTPKFLNHITDDDTDLNEVGSHLSENTETTLPTTSQDEATTIASDYIELDGSEATTTPGSVSHSVEDEVKSHESEGDSELDGTPELKTIFTTFTFYTTFYKDKTSSITSRLETVTNVVSGDGSESTAAEESSVSESEQPSVEPTYPITYYTTYTYWTTSFSEGTPVVTSREETVSNVVTPGIDDIAPSTTDTAVSATQAPELELTTYFTTYTYFTTSYLGEKPVVTSRLETVTNVVSGSVTEEAVVAPTSTIAGRAVGTVKPEIVDNQATDDDYDAPTGLLSTIVSSDVNDQTTTLYSTDVYGSYIDGIYAQVLESTSQIIKPTASAETVFINDPSSTQVGLVNVNEGKTLDADGIATTYFSTKTYGTVIDGRYAQLIERGSSVMRNPKASLEPSEDPYKTGLVRIIDGSLVEGDQTTFYTSKILGTFIDNQYAQVIESTSHYVLNPSKSEEFTTVFPTKLSELEGSEGVTEEIPTTTEKNNQEEEDKDDKNAGPLRRFPGRGRNSNSRLAFTASSKSFTPFITPFASRSRPAFAPRRKQSSAVIVSRTDVTPTVTATLASRTASGASRSNSFASRNRRPLFNKPGADVEVTTESSVTSSADQQESSTPKLPPRSRFQRPSGSSARPAVSGSSISPTSASSRGSSFPGASGSSRSRGFSSRISLAPSVTRGRGSSSAGFSRPSSSSSFSASSAGARGSTSSRFNPRGRSTITPSSTQVTTVKPTQTQVSPQDDEYEIIEYEYEEPASSSSTSTTTEAPKTNNRFGGGGNRFRLSPRLSTPNTPTTPSTTAPRTTARGLPFLRRNLIGRPTPISRTSATPENVEDDEEEQAPEAPVTQKSTSPAPPAKPSSRPSFGSRSRTTPIPLPASTTTKRTFAPRSRPSNFPNRGLFRPGPTPQSSSTTADAAGDDDGELDYQETRNGPVNVTSIAAAPQEPADSVTAEESVPTFVRVKAPEGFSSSSSGGSSASSSSGGSSFPQMVNIDDLLDSGSEFFSNAVQSPYEAYEYVSDDAGAGNNVNGGGSDVGSIYTGSGRRVLRRSVRQVDFVGSRSRGSINFRSANSNINNNYRSRQPSSRSSTYYSDYDDYYYEPNSPTAAPTTAPPPVATTSRSANRFRGRIQPTTTARRTPFTLTNSDTSSSSLPSSPSSNTRSSYGGGSSRSSSNTNSRSPSSSSSGSAFTRRNQSRYQRPTEAPTTTTPASRFRSRYNQNRGSEVTTPRSSSSSRSRFPSSSGRGRGSSTFADRGRYDSYNSNPKDEYVEPSFESLSTITVTHYVPKETTIPFVNGKSTEYKTILTPSASKEVLAPYQYTRSEYQGSPVLVFNNELTSTPSFGVTEVTRFLIRESTTTSVTFTPTTIRGRRTSFSHILPSTVYSVEPVVSTLTPLNTLTDPNQLTNLLLNQLLGNLNLNPANLLGLNLANNNNPNGGLMNVNGDPATPITQFNTKTTSYVTTVTDFTSTVIPITLHGKSIKTTIVESSTHVITATEFITESTVITPSPTQVFQQQQQTLLGQNNALNGINPAFLQGLLQQQQQQQQQLLLKQQPIIPTQAAQLPSITQTANILQRKDFDQEEESMKEVRVEKAPVVEVKKNEFSVVTLYVSGRNPGEFSTVLSTVPVESRSKRSVPAEGAFSVEPHRSAPEQVVPTQVVFVPLENQNPEGFELESSQSSFYPGGENEFNSLLARRREGEGGQGIHYYNPLNDVDFDDNYDNGDDDDANAQILQGSYSMSINNILSGNSNINIRNNKFKPTQSLDSVLGDVSNVFSSQSSLAYY